MNSDWGGSRGEVDYYLIESNDRYNNVLTIKICQNFDGASLKCMLTWHTNYLENKNTPLHLKKVADP